MAGRIEDPAELARRALAVFLGVHGLAHLVGTESSWRFADEGGIAHYLGGLWEISDPSLLRVVGALWMVPAAAFLVAAWRLWSRAPSWLPVLVVAAVLSLVLCLVALWAAVIGLAIDFVLLAFAVWRAAHRHGVAEAEPPSDAR